MSRRSGEDAVDRARAALGVDAAVPGEALLVHRLEPGARPYYLVLLGTPGTTVGVAAVDAGSGEPMNFASLPGAGPHLSVSACEARRRAGLPDGSVARLVWEPSRQSRSPLLPLWEVVHGGSTAYVDQAGGVWPGLDAGGRGGGVPA